jgi:hypothetical protein
MVGSLVSSCNNNADIVEFDENYRKTKKYGTALDVLTMTELMNASVCDRAFSFEDLSTADGAKPGETLRSSGLILSSKLLIKIVPVSYTNRQSNAEQLKYKYLPVISIESLI